MKYESALTEQRHVEVAKLKLRALADPAKIVRTELAGTQIVHHAPWRASPAV
jgi:hypothetical protein